MRFFERQQDARRRTRWLIAAFAVAILAVVALVDLALATLGGRHPTAVLARYGRDPLASLADCWWIFAAIGWLTWRRSRELAGGGAVVARSLGAVPATRASADAAVTRLLNVVEEMSVAARVPVPGAYVLSDEDGINALAAGRTPDDAAIVVTRGALDAFTRDELQAVVAHEFSHVVNGDMALNLRLVAWLHGLQGVTVAGRGLCRRRGWRWIPTFQLLGWALIGIGAFGHLAGRVLQAAVARRREELADASAVQFTRHPAALRSALLKVAEHPAGSALTAPAAVEVAHMLFADDGLWRRFTGRLLATHPTLESRLQALDEDAPPEATAAAPAGVAGAAGDAAVAGTVAAVVPTAALAPATATPPATAAVTAPAAAPSRAVRYPPPVDPVAGPQAATALRLLESAARGADAVPVLLAAVVTGAPTGRPAQLAAIGRAFGDDAARVAARLIAALDGCAPRGRFGAVTAALAPLAALPEAERARVGRAVATLAAHDPAPSVLRACVAALVALRLAPPPVSPPLSLPDAAGAIAALGAVAACVGSTDLARQRHAYATTAAALPASSRRPFAPPSDWPAAIAAGYGALARLHPAARRPVADALARGALADGRLAVEELELLRGACVALGVGLPASIGDASLQDEAHAPAAVVLRG